MRFERGRPIVSGPARLELAFLPDPGRADAAALGRRRTERPGAFFRRRVDGFQRRPPGAGSPANGRRGALGPRRWSNAVIVRRGPSSGLPPVADAGREIRPWPWLAGGGRVLRVAALERGSLRTFNGARSLDCRWFPRNLVRGGSGSEGTMRGRLFARRFCIGFERRRGLGRRGRSTRGHSAKRDCKHEGEKRTFSTACSRRVASGLTRPASMACVRSGLAGDEFHRVPFRGLPSAVAVVPCDRVDSGGIRYRTSISTTTTIGEKSMPRNSISAK